MKKDEIIEKYNEIFQKSSIKINKLLEEERNIKEQKS
jgi:hypothetical protein